MGEGGAHRQRSGLADTGDNGCPSNFYSKFNERIAPSPQVGAIGIEDIRLLGNAEQTVAAPIQFRDAARLCQAAALTTPGIAAHSAKTARSILPNSYWGVVKRPRSSRICFRARRRLIDFFIEDHPLFQLLGGNPTERCRLALIPPAAKPSVIALHGQSAHPPAIEC